MPLSPRLKSAPKKVFLLTSVTLLALGLWAFWWEPASLTVRRETLRVPGWPAGRRGLRVAVLTDLHVGSPHTGLEKSARFGERYAMGHVVEDGRHLCVSGVVGTSIIPVRFRVPPGGVVLALEP